MTKKTITIIIERAEHAQAISEAIQDAITDKGMGIIVDLSADLQKTVLPSGAVTMSATISQPEPQQISHPHAALMAEYAKDAAETDKPWERWHFNGAGTWNDLADHPSWSKNNEYRRKPKTIRIGEYDVPEPMREEPEVGTVCFAADTTDKHGYSTFTWLGDSNDYYRLEAGLYHSTTEAARLHTKAMISLTSTK